MTEVTLLLVIVALCGLIGWQDFNNRKERKVFINAIKSKTAQDYKDMELLDKVEPKVEPPAEDTPLEDVDVDRFSQLIEKEAGGQQ